MRVGESPQGVGAHRRCSRRCEQRQPPRPRGLRRSPPGTGQRCSTAKSPRCWRHRTTPCSTSRWCRCSWRRPTSAKAAGATLFYGLVPTTSEQAEGARRSSTRSPSGRPAPTSRAHLVGPLRGLADSFPRPGRALTADLASIAGNAGDSDHNAMKRLLLLLRQLAVEFDAFGDNAGPTRCCRCSTASPCRSPTPPASRSKAAARRAISWPRPRASLLNEESISPAPTIPAGWPELDATTREALARALSACLQLRFAAVAGVAGALRRTRGPLCAARLRAPQARKATARPARWGDYSPAFVIALVRGRQRAAGAGAAARPGRQGHAQEAPGPTSPSPCRPRCEPALRRSARAVGRQQARRQRPPSWAGSAASTFRSSPSAPSSC